MDATELAQVELAFRTFKRRDIRICPINHCAEDGI